MHAHIAQILRSESGSGDPKRPRKKSCCWNALNYPIVSFFQIIFGNLGDRYGNRKLLACCLLILGVSQVSDQKDILWWADFPITHKSPSAMNIFFSTYFHIKNNEQTVTVTVNRSSGSAHISSTPHQNTLQLSTEIAQLLLLLSIL